MGHDQQVISTGESPDSTSALPTMPIPRQSAFDFVPPTDTHPSSDTEADVQYSLMRCRAFVELAADGILVGTPDGVIMDVNKIMCSFLGLTRSEVLGHPLTSLPFTPESIQKSPFRFDLLRQGTTLVAERTIKRGDGVFVTVEMRTKMMPDGAIYSISRDISERKREEKALRESEERYRQLFELESDAIFLIDNEVGQILEANEAASTLYGYSREQLVAMRNSDLSAEPEATQRATHGGPQLRGNLVVIPLRFHRKADGIVFAAEITARFFIQSGRSVHIAAVRDITERKRVEDELRNSEERFKSLAETLELRVINRTKELKSANVSLAQSVSQLRNLALELTLAEEQERKRLALLLHDHLQPFLVAATMKVALLDQTACSNEQLQTVKELLSLIKSAIAASRSLTMDLYPPILLDAGLMPGLRWLVEWVKDTYGLSVELVGQDSLEVSEPMGILLFQTIRELLFNVAKHAKTDLAMVSLCRHDENILEITVEDNGIGFAVVSPDYSSPSGGLGLFHLRERLMAVGGTLEVESKIGEGTRVMVTVPLPP